MKLCIHADDYGFSKAITAGIQDCIKKGYVKSVSVMSVLLEESDVEFLIQYSPQLSVGLHFSLTIQCNKYLPPFPHQYALAMATIGRKKYDACIQKELEYQYALLVQKFPFKITHIDTHQHIHILPRIRRIIDRFAKKNHIPYVRQGKSISTRFSLKNILYNTLMPAHKDIALIGLDIMYHAIDYNKLINDIKYAQYKGFKKLIWITHPGYATHDPSFTDIYNHQREKEIELIYKASEYFQKNNLSICTLTDLLSA